MDRDIHFERMRETGKIVIPFIKDAYLKIGSQNNHLFNSLNYFVSKRTNDGQCLLRPYLVRLGYELSGKNNWIDIASACAAAEIFNISTYQSNIAFDNKNGVFTSSQKNNQFVASMLSLELAIDLILKLENNFDKTAISQIIDSFHQTNRDIYIGQFFDLNELTINNLDLSMPEDIFLSLYLQRCEKLGGSLTSLCFEVGCLLGGGSNNLSASLKKIGTMLGTAGQIVNDVSDYIPQEQLNDNINGYKPYFSDLKAGKLTFPLFHVLTHVPLQKNKIIMDILNEKKINNSTMKEIILLLCQYGTIKSIREIIWSYYKILKKEVKKIPKTQYRDFLSITFSSLLTNKYFAILREYTGAHNAKRT